MSDTYLTNRKRRKGDPDKQMNRYEREFIRVKLHQKTAGSTGLNGRNWSDKRLYDPLASQINSFNTEPAPPVSASLLQRICYISESEPDITLNEPSWLQTDVIYAFVLDTPNACRADAMRNHLSLFAQWYPDDEEVVRIQKLVAMTGNNDSPAVHEDAQDIRKQLKKWRILAISLLFAIICILTAYVSQLIGSRTPPCLVAPGMLGIPGGSFRMGNTFGEIGDSDKDELPVHAVSLDSFLLSETEITFEQYDCFTNATGKPHKNDDGTGRGDKPVIYVCWLDAVEYCNWLSGSQGLRHAYIIQYSDGYECPAVSLDTLSDGYRLPTEAEWEYAASWTPDGKSLYGNGKNVALTAEINFQTEEAYSPKPLTRTVKSGEPNPLGLYNMSGNVFEWCQDWYGEEYYTQCGSFIKNPRGPDTGLLRVLRGGGWYYEAEKCRSSYREVDHPMNRDHNTGFRVARSIKKQ